MRYQFLHTEIQGGPDGLNMEYAYVLDLETGETLKSPVVQKRVPPPVRTVADARENVPGQIRRSLPPVQLERRDEDVPAEAADAEEKPAGYVNPFAEPNPAMRRYAWQDPDWVEPKERRRKNQYTRSPVLGEATQKVFREPGKFGDGQIDYTPDPHG